MASENGAAHGASGPTLAGLTRAWRERALLTQEQLAERTGLGVRTIRRLESGELRRPRSESVRLLADAFGLSDADRKLLVAVARGEPATPPLALVPRQLPADMVEFTGRTGELRRLDTLLSGGRATAVVISAIRGTAGVGKTALAVHWAHRVAGRFPDGQLYVNLRGYAAGPPIPPIQALALLLRGLGVPADRVPVDVAAAAALYRSLLAGKRVLVLLDNARDAEQVRPLLPGSPQCLVVVTSRERLAGLIATHGAHPFTLDVLSPAEASALLGSILGADRVAAEPDPAAELAGLCGHLPLALRISAAHLAIRPDQPIADYVAAVRAGDRLSELAVEDDPQAAVRTAFDSSYAALDPPAQRVFRLLGLVPGPDFGAGPVAALAGIGTAAADRLLDRLAAAHLLEPRAAGRFGIHDLLRDYARERTEQLDDPTERQAATERLLSWYLHAADAAAALLYPHTLRAPVPDPEPDLPPPGFAAAADALAWLEAERASLVAATQHAGEHGPRPLASLLADTLRGYFLVSRHTVEWLAVAHAGRAAAVADDDPRAHAAAELSIGLARCSLGDWPPAVEHLRSALGLAGRAGWVDGQAAILDNLGIVHTTVGRPEQAADYHRQALALCEQTGRLVGQATILGNLGGAAWELGRLAEARAHHARALAICRELDAPSGATIALANLGEVERDLGRSADAHEHLAAALELCRELGNRYGEVHVLHGLAVLHRDAGRLVPARDLAETTVALAVEIGDQRLEAEARTALGSVHVRLGRRQQAAEHYRRALALARQVGVRYVEADAGLGLAEVYRQQGQHRRAVESAEAARGIAGEAGYRVLTGRAHTVLAAIHLAAGSPDLAGPAAAATDAAAAAVAAQRSTEHRLELARALLVLGQTRQRLADPTAAAAAWREALDLCAPLDAEEATELRALLAAHPG